MARVPSVVQTERTPLPRSSATAELARLEKPCSICGSTEIRASNTRNALDILLACLFLTPYRCQLCRTRFYRLRPLRAHSSPAPLLTMPPHHGLLNLDSPEPEAIERPVQAESTAVIKPIFIEPATAKPSVQKPDPVRAGPGSIVILEDDLPVRKLLRRLLERRGYSAEEIARTEDLPGEWHERRVDLLIVDVSLTGKTGFEAVVTLARTYPDLKILALTSEALDSGEFAGRVLVLPKPFPLHSFVDCVDRLFGRAGALDRFS
jgi:CheY-like chemotaxis protein